MRVGFPRRTFDVNVGGNSTYSRELVRGLSSLGVQTRVLGRAGVGVGPPGLRFALSETVIPFKHRTDVDVIHYPADTGALFGAAQPIVATVHGVASAHLPHVRDALAERLWRQRVRRCAQVADRVITVSESSRRDVAQLCDLDEGSVTVIPHGVDHRRFCADTSTRDEDLVAGVARNMADYILYLGNLDPRKNVQNLLAAHALYRRRGGTRPLVVAGKHAWGQKEVVDQLRSAEGVRYLGGVADDVVAPLLRRAACFVFPSLYEGFGLPVLEAMACGTPVITSNRGALAEVAGDAALRVDPTDASDIARGLHYSHDSALMSELRTRGLAHVRPYTWEASAAAHLAVYAAVCR